VQPFCFGSLRVSGFLVRVPLPVPLGSLPLAHFQAFVIFLFRSQVLLPPVHLTRGFLFMDSKVPTSFTAQIHSWLFLSPSEPPGDLVLHSIGSHPSVLAGSRTHFQLKFLAQPPPVLALLGFATADSVAGLKDVFLCVKFDRGADLH
jgi:hypothetical protein